MGGSSTQTSPNHMTAAKALAIRGSAVPPTCTFDINDSYDMTLRSEGWSKHAGKNGNPFWAAIGDAKLSTWTRPNIGELEQKKKRNAAIKTVSASCLALGILTQKEVDDTWALILKKTRSADAVIKEWRAKELNFKAKQASSPGSSSIPPQSSGSTNLAGAPMIVDNFRKREPLFEDEDDADSDVKTEVKTDSPSTIASTTSSSKFSAFNKANSRPPANDFAMKAIAWTKEELVTHLRTKGLAPIAQMFEKEVIDGKTLALMQTEDLTDPTPNGFGLSEADPMFQALWSLKLQLKAALDRSELKKKFASS